MIVANHQLECCQVYVNCRKAVLEDNLYGLGVEKLSIEEVQKMPWDILEDTIRKWIRIQAMKVGALVLFANEKLLCEQLLCEYKDTLEQLFKEKNKDGMSLSGIDDGELDVLGGDDGDKIER
ncbi:unnamed protein product [Sphagnum balticum]